MSTLILAGVRKTSNFLGTLGTIFVFVSIVGIVAEHFHKKDTNHHSRMHWDLEDQ